MNRVVQVLSQRATHIAIGLLALFVVLAIAVPPESLKRGMDAGRLGFALAVFAICVSPAVWVFIKGVKSRFDQVTVAIALVWFVILTQAIWIPISAANPEVPAWVPAEYVPMLLPYLPPSDSIVLPSWFPRSQVAALFPYLFMISAAFFLIPIGNGRAEVPSGNWPLIAGACALGGTAVGLAIGLGFNG